MPQFLCSWMFDGAARGARRSMSLCLTLTLSGCALAAVDRAPLPGEAQLIVAMREDGEPAVRIYSIDSAHHVVTQEIAAARSLSLRVGAYNVEVNCLRAGAIERAGTTFNFKFSVKPDRRYVLDCRPDAERGDNGFIIRAVN